MKTSGLVVDQKMAELAEWFAGKSTRRSWLDRLGGMLFGGYAMHLLAGRASAAFALGDPAVDGSCLADTEGWSSVAGGCQDPDGNVWTGQLVCFDTATNTWRTTTGAAQNFDYAHAPSGCSYLNTLNGGTGLYGVNTWHVPTK